MFDRFDTFKLQLSVSLTFDERNRVSHLPQELNLDSEQYLDLLIFFPAIILLTSFDLLLSDGSLSHCLIYPRDHKRPEFLVDSEAPKSGLVRWLVQLLVEIVFAHIDKVVASWG